MNDLSKLVQILGYKRPHGSAEIEELADILFAGLDSKVWTDPDGNALAITVEVGEGSKTLFSCHLDTVHRTAGRQILVHDSTSQLIYKNDAKDTECLGADDGAGIWLLMQMIEHGIPGMYVFHYGEERGGIGSSGMRDYHEDFLKQFSRAVAFDRRGQTSVITHQSWGRCCSPEFAEALCLQLNQSLLDMAPDDSGTFTDTANYVEVIPECTNVSIGYEHEHSKDEHLDYEYLFRLRDACIAVEWEGLPVVRAAEPMTYEGLANFSWDRWGDYKASSRKDDLTRMRWSELVKWVTANRFDPELIADEIYELCDRLTEAEGRIEDLENFSNPMYAEE